MPRVFLGFENERAHETALQLLKIRPEKERLAFDRQRFQTAQASRKQILEMFQNAFGDVGGEGGVAIPQEFGRNIALFQPGGQFGAGGRAEVERGGQEAIAAGQIGLAQTGVSSGTNVAGLRARVSADTALARKKIEDERIARLSQAFTGAGSAKLQQQQTAADLHRAFLTSLGGFA